MSVLVYGYMYICYSYPSTHVCVSFSGIFCTFASFIGYMFFVFECLNFCMMSNPFEDLHGFVAQNHTKSWEVMKGCHYASLLIGRIAVCFGSKRWYLFFTSPPECP
jgi:hypothetical protein